MKLNNCILFTILLEILTLTFNEICADSEPLRRCRRATTLTSCVLTPKGMEGPYYLPLNLLRSDIREDRAGIKFRLKLTVNNVRLCEPLKNVSVDIWQADAAGIYSSYVENSLKLLRPGDRHAQPTDNTTFLRGVQFTNDKGVVEFITIFPGPYASRTPHIHVSVQVDGAKVYVGQIYFKHSSNQQILDLMPYRPKRSRYTKNEDDYIFVHENGVNSTIQSLVPIDGKNIANGIMGEMILGIDPKL